MDIATVKRFRAKLAVSGWTHHREAYGDALMCALMERDPSLTWFLAFDGYEHDIGVATLSLWVASKSEGEYREADAQRAADDTHFFIRAWIAGYMAAERKGH